MFHTSWTKRPQLHDDVEMEPIGANEHQPDPVKGPSWRTTERTDYSFRTLVNPSWQSEEERKRRHCQRILQDGYPTFVPTFSSLREKCLERTSDQLRDLETQIGSITGLERDELVDRAAELLRDLDRQFDAIADRHQLDNPSYAAQRGLSLTHFTLDSGEKKGEWMLLSSNWGPESESITESDFSKLNSIKQDWLTKFSGDAMPPIVAFKRQKTVTERQRWALVQDGDILVPSPKRKRMWSIALGLGFTALVCFLGVGIIATTTTFSPIFVEYFFWIAILWTLASSSLLTLIVRAYGANGKDCMSAFLAGVAIWLVVIQIGQTKLNGQTGVGN